MDESKREYWKIHLLAAGLAAVLFLLGCSMGSVSAEESEPEAAGICTVKLEKVTGEYASQEYPVLENVDGYDQSILDGINEKFRTEAERAVAEEDTNLQEAYESAVEFNPDTALGKDSFVYEVTVPELYLDGDLFSAAQFMYMYSGGAHGYGCSIGYNYNLRTGEELSMGDLLGCSEEEAMDRIVEAYREAGIIGIENITEESIRGASDMMEYWVSAEGMTVDIPTYGVASYAAGPQQVLIRLDGTDRLDSEQNASDQPEAAKPDGTSETITVIAGIEADAADFIFPYSSERLLTEEDLKLLEGDSVEEEHYRSQLAINEILARYGYVFRAENGGAAKEAYDQFEGKPWYESAKPHCPSASANEMLYQYITETELDNIDRICEWQKVHGCYY